MLTGSLAILVLLLGVNAFFVLSELAVISASKPLLRQRARQGDKRAAKALALAEHPGHFLSTVQTGITLLGILTGAYSSATLATVLAGTLDGFAFIRPHGETVAVALVVSALTFLSVVFAELVPKQVALRNPEKFAMWTAGIMTFVALVTKPLVRLFGGSAYIILTLMGHKRQGKNRVTEAVLKAVIAEGAESGAIEASEHELMRRIIRLGDRDVESIITHRMDVTFIDVNDRLEVILEKLHETGHSHYPVIDGGPDMVLGIVHVKDLIGLPAGEPATAVREHLKLAPVLAGNVNCLKALELFKSSDAHMAIVIDEYGTTEGIVTAFDLLEAIVGELPSNFEEGEGAQIVKREDGSYLVDGLTPVDEIHLELGLDTFEEDGGYQTIAGFVIDQLGRAPATGDVLEKSGYRFEVIDMDGRRIDKILISRTDPELPFFN